MTQTEALKLALEALEGLWKDGFEGYPAVLHEQAITAIKEALAQPEQEPVARESLLGAIARGWCHEKNANKEMDADLVYAIATEIKALYTSPPPQRKPLTDTRVKVKLGSQYGEDLAGHWFFLQPADNFADAALAKHSGIEAAHGIKE